MSSSDLRLHFVGTGGSGMSALALYHSAGGGWASGSDRAFDAGERSAERARLEAAGVRIVPQDGSAVDDRLDAVIASTAIEAAIPDLAAARDRNLPIRHRSELLADFIAERRAIAVTGTSGKSTVVAMIFEILYRTGRDPSLLTGGPLVMLENGNAHRGGGDGVLVVEADESDGSLVRYRPWRSVVLNLQRDHKEPAEVAEMFATLADRTDGPPIRGDDPNLDFLGPEALCFGIGPGRGLRAESIELAPDRSRFACQGVPFDLPVPGRHNVLNALAAAAACREAGVPLAESAEALSAFRGVARRFRSLGAAGGVEVIDDFAHNPEKIRAALAAAHLRADRVLAVFQPHGFGPTRFLRDDLVEAFIESLDEGDRLWLTEIYYAGGTVDRNISSRDIVEPVAATGRDARVAASRADLPGLIADAARPGDLVIVMGARDPSLSELCRDIHQTLARTLERT